MTTKQTKTRAYVVTVDGTPGARPRLVEATYAHMAERHVIGSIVHARVASKRDLIDLLSNGVKLEQADEGSHDSAELFGATGDDATFADLPAIT